MNIYFIKLPIFSYFVFVAPPLRSEYCPGYEVQDLHGPPSPPPPPPVKEIYMVTPLEAHGHDMSIIRMLKLFYKSYPQILVDATHFHCRMWNAKFAPIYKVNYKPVSLIPFCSKVSERIIYNTMFSYFTISHLKINRDLSLVILV